MPCVFVLGGEGGQAMALVFREAGDSASQNQAPEGPRCAPGNQRLSLSWVGKWRVGRPRLWPPLEKEPTQERQGACLPASCTAPRQPVRQRWGSSTQLQGVYKPGLQGPGPPSLRLTLRLTLGLTLGTVHCLRWAQGDGWAVSACPPHPMAQRIGRPGVSGYRKSPGAPSWGEGVLARGEGM